MTCGHHSRKTWQLLEVEIVVRSSTILCSCCLQRTHTNLIVQVLLSDRAHLWYRVWCEVKPTGIQQTRTPNPLIQHYSAPAVFQTAGAKDMFIGSQNGLLYCMSVCWRQYDTKETQKLEMSMVSFSHCGVWIKVDSLWQCSFFFILCWKCALNIRELDLINPWWMLNNTVRTLQMNTVFLHFKYWIVYFKHNVDELKNEKRKNGNAFVVYFLYFFSMENLEGIQLWVTLKSLCEPPVASYDNGPFLNYKRPLLPKQSYTIHAKRT